MRELSPDELTGSILPRRALGELSGLQASVYRLGDRRNIALRMFFASRHSTTPIAQREFWLEFSWLDHEYRAAVRCLAEFCREYRGSPQRSARSA
jgi:hypothetical protein